MVGVESDFTSGFYEETIGSVTFDQVSYATITDANADNPFGFNIIQKTYSKTGEDVVYISYGLINTLGQGIPNTFAGIFMDWDIGTYTANSGGIAVDEHLVYQYEPGTTNPYFGIVALNGLSGGIVSADNAATTDDLRSAGIGFLSNGGDNTDPGSGDQRSWIGSSLGVLADADTTWVTFAIVAGDDLHDIRFLAEKAFILGEQAGLTDLVVGVENSLEIPMNYEISQNYPNPFNPATVIQYALPLQSHVKINVYNTLGQLVTKLVDSDITAGYHQIQFNASNLSSGVYFYSIQAESIDGSKNFQIVKKMMLVK